MFNTKSIEVIGKAKQTVAGFMVSNPAALPQRHL
jgi:hypothetical protein